MKQGLRYTMSMVRLWMDGWIDGWMDEYHGCKEVVMQGLRAHSDSFLAAMWLECYVLLHYFERTRGHKGWIWEPCKH